MGEGNLLSHGRGSSRLRCMRPSESVQTAVLQAQVGGGGWGWARGCGVQGWRLNSGG